MRLHRLIGSAAAVAALLPPAAAADSVYHSEHLRLTPVAGAPLRSGFVENIKAEGPVIYAHEIFVLNGAGARVTYTVTRNFFLGETCSGTVSLGRRDVPDQRERQRARRRLHLTRGRRGLRGQAWRDVDGPAHPGQSSTRHDARP